jgi:hypothetical protein
MGASASAPPGDDEKSPDPENPEDELEMTSIMDADQRRELQRVAREAARAKEPERETARPPAEVSAALAAEELAIPRAGGVPSDVSPVVDPPSGLDTPALGLASVPAPARAPAPAAGAAQKAPASDGWMLFAFVLLAAAVAFALRG